MVLVYINVSYQDPLFFFPRPCRCRCVARPNSTGIYHQRHPTPRDVHLVSTGARCTLGTRCFHPPVPDFHPLHPIRMVLPPVLRGGETLADFGTTRIGLLAELARVLVVESHGEFGGDVVEDRLVQGSVLVGSGVGDPVGEVDELVDEVVDSGVDDYGRKAGEGGWGGRRGGFQGSLRTDSADEG